LASAASQVMSLLGRMEIVYLIMEKIKGAIKSILGTINDVIKLMENEVNPHRLIIREFLEADQIPPRTHECPDCGGEMRVIVERTTSRHFEKKLSMGLDCDHCGAAFHSSHVEPLPKWVDNLPGSEEDKT
jgi:predicted RNA-binding Zn-ribbon protein involved in translation (DUF1610 family)